MYNFHLPEQLQLTEILYDYYQLHNSPQTMLIITYHRICSHTHTFVHHVAHWHKFDRGLSRLLHTELHWLDVPERVVYKLGVMVFNCLHGQVLQYLVELCQPVAGVASRQHLRSAAQRLLVVPRHQLSSYGRRAFCVAGVSVWNSLPDSLWNPIIGGNSFRQSLKTFFLFATYWCIQCITGFMTTRYINRLLNYLLTLKLIQKYTVQTLIHSTIIW